MHSTKCRLSVLCKKMLWTALLLLTTLLTSTKCESKPSLFLVPTLYSYGDCSSVPQPQTLTIYLNTLLQEGQSRALLIGTGRTTTEALWAQTRDNTIDNVFEYPLIALNREAQYYFFCLNYYCYEEPTEEVLMESNGTCDQMEAASGVYGYIDNDPAVSFTVANKGPDFMHVYPVLPINYPSMNATYHILNPTRYQDGYIQGFALRALVNGTEVTITPTVTVNVFRPATPTLELETETIEAYEEFELYFDELETVWIEVEVESCDSSVSLTGTLIQSSHELAVFSSQALCNETSVPPTDTPFEALPFSYIFSPLHQLPPVRKWGTHYVSDIKKLSSFPEASGEFYVVSFSILSAAESGVSIACYNGREMMKACSAHQVIGPGEIWHYKLQLKTMLEAEAVYIHGTTPVMILYETYSQKRDGTYHSEMLQPTKWFSSKQMVPVLHSLDSQPHAFVVSLVIPDLYVEMEQLRVWDNRENEEPSKLGDFDLVSSYSHVIVQKDTLVRILLDPTGYNGSDYVLQFTITDAKSSRNIKFGASIFSFGSYAYSNGYILGELENVTRTYPVSGSNMMGVVLGSTVGAVVILLVAVLTMLLLVLCHVKGLNVLPWLLPPPSQGFEYDIFLSFADEDKEFAQKILYEPLRNKGYRVLLHLTDFIAGATIEDNIIRAVNTSRVVVYVCSKNFNQSSFCQTELKYGMESHYNEYKGRYRRVIPVWIGGECPAQLNTFRIRPIKTSGVVEDHNEDTINCLLKSLHLGKPTCAKTGKEEEFELE